MRFSKGVPVQLVADISHDGWESVARCRTHDPALFFGPNRFEPKRERLEREAEAKAVCATCPALDACREYALRNGEVYGVWGGLGEADRRALLDARPVAVAAV
jgi:WhiB family transcriptional regulator, redox-sensing transcriptional regulator